jgi:hypothetical protein
MIDLSGIILAVVMLGITAYVLFLMNRNAKKKKIKDSPQAHRERAVWAWARIASSNHGAAGLGGMVRVTLELEVHLPGTAQYTATTTWLVEQEMLKYMEAGKEISLKADPLDTKYIYPNGSWAKVVE